MARGKEGRIEQYLCKQVKLLGGRAEKMVYFAKRGSPDRWCIFPGPYIFPIECKDATGVLHPLQRLELDKLTAEGFTCFVVYSIEDVDKAVLKMKEVMHGKPTNI